MNNSVKFLLASVALAVLAACGGGGDDSPADIVNTAAAELRYVNLEQTNQSTTLYDNLSEIPNTTGGYKFASRYQQIHDDSHPYVIREGGTLETNRYVLDPQRGHKYTLLKLADGNTANELLFIDDPYNNGATTTRARIRVVNAYNPINPYAGQPNAFDVYLLPQGTDVQAAQPFIANVGYRGIEPGSGGESKLIDAGTYELTIGMPAPAGQQKLTPFTALVNVPADGDWLIVIIQDAGTIVPNLVHVLVVPDNANPFEPVDTTP